MSDKGSAGRVREGWRAGGEGGEEKMVVVVGGGATEWNRQACTPLVFSTSQGKATACEKSILQIPSPLPLPLRGKNINTHTHRNMTD